MLSLHVRNQLTNHQREMQILTNQPQDSYSKLGTTTSQYLFVFCNTVTQFLHNFPLASLTEPGPLADHGPQPLAGDGEEALRLQQQGH